MSAAEFQQFLVRLEASIKRDRGVGADLIVEGDLNARSTSWGDRITGSRGDDLAAFADSLGRVTGSNILRKGDGVVCRRNLRL